MSLVWAVAAPEAANNADANRSPSFADLFISLLTRDRRWPAPTRRPSRTSKLTLESLRLSPRVLTLGRHVQELPSAILPRGQRRHHGGGNRCTGGVDDLSLPHNMHTSHPALAYLLAAAHIDQVR